MKIRNITLPVILLAFLMYGCGNNLFNSIADDDSNEACIYETSKNLDTGNYDSVLASSCLDNLQKGAAYLGKADFDVKDVINSLSEAQDTTADLDIYLNTLVSGVSESSLNFLELAASSYDEVVASSDSYEDAQFYKSIVKSLRSMSLLKLVTDINGDGSLSSCDINNNGTSDDVDAVVCSLRDVANLACVKSSAARTATDITIQGKTGTYRGLTVTIDVEVPDASCPASYKQLHYLVTGTTYGAATVTSDSCQELTPNATRTWPCPVESGTEVLDLVEAFDEAITDSIDALGNSFTTNNDIFDSIQDIKTDACGLDAVCSSTELADYLSQL